MMTFYVSGGNFRCARLLICRSAWISGNDTISQTFLFSGWYLLSSVLRVEFKEMIYENEKQKNVCTIFVKMSLFLRFLMLSSIKLMQLDILIFSSNEMNQVDEREVDNEDDAILDVDDEEERPSNANTHYVRRRWCTSASTWTICSAYTLLQSSMQYWLEKEHFANDLVSRKREPIMRTYLDLFFCNFFALVVAVQQIISNFHFWGYLTTKGSNIM